MKNFLGIVGGIGPLATAYFMRKIINSTNVSKDQDHINMMILNHTDIPDRTQYIINNSLPNPYPYLLKDCGILEAAGASLIAIPCNTSHYFYDDLILNINTPIVNMLKETTKYLKNQSKKKAGIMATTGTITTNLFQNALKESNIEYEVLDKFLQDDIMNIIYKEVKAGNKPNMKRFFKIANCFLDKGCDTIILGCTELSILNETFNLGELFVDALDVVSKYIVNYFNKDVKDIKDFLI